MIEVDERQTRFRDTRDSNVEANVVLVPLEGRSIDDDENFSSAFAQAFDDIFFPDVLANWETKAHTFKRHWPRQRPLVKHSFFVEHAIIGQLDLGAHSRHLAAVDQHDRVINLVAVRPDGADDDSRSSDEIHSKPLDCGATRGGKGWLLDEVFGRIAADEKFREYDQVGALVRRFGTRAHELGCVAAQISQHRVHLRQRNSQGRCLCHLTSRSELQ